jgi:16S rRNA (guanine527-N7)-methyltransferase
MIDEDERARADFIAAYDVSRETSDALERYRLLLSKWSKQINLIGPATKDHFWQRHTLDCAQILPIAGPNVTKLVDFGSGAGLPGLILAALLQDRGRAYQVILIEVSAKRCSFLREAARALDVKIDLLQEKIGDVKAFKVDLITARAFAPLDALLAYAHPWAELGARMIFLKGEDVHTEIRKASTKWQFQTRIETSVTDLRGRVVEIFDLRPL